MKKTLLLLMACASVSLASAQSYYYLSHPNEGNPSGLNTESDQSTTNNGWTSIRATSATAVYSRATAIPFAFEFAGQPVTHFKASSTGFVTFDTAVSGTPPVNAVSLPNANIPNKSVTFMGLSMTGSNDQILTKTFGTVGKRQFWIKFFSMSTAGNTANHWNYVSVVLEETSNKIYLVRMECNSQSTYESPTHSIGIQIDASNAKMVAGSPNITNEVSSIDASDNTYYEFIYGTQPADELQAMNVVMEPYVKRTLPATVKANFRNGGSATVNSATIHYSLDGGAAVSSNVSSLNLSVTGTITHPIPLNIPTVGNHTIKVWASNPNGNTDPIPSNDTTSYTFFAYDSAAHRRVLHESFSSSTCGPCFYGNRQLKTVLEFKPEEDYVMVKYQCDFPSTGDPYYTSEIGTRRSFYGVNSIPATSLDGDPVFNPSSYSTSMFDQYAAAPSFLNISLNSHMEWKNNVFVDVNVTPTEDVPGNYRLYVVIDEKRTVNNVKTNGESEFFHVVKKFMPTTGGTAVSGLAKGVTKTYNLSYAFPGGYRLPANAGSPINLNTEHSVEEMWDLEVIAWVQNNTTKEVLQATRADVQFNVGNKDIAADRLTVKPNPANQWISLGNFTGNGTLTVSDASGRIIYSGAIDTQNNQITTANWSNGMYILNVQTATGVLSGKVLIQH